MKRPNVITAKRPKNGRSIDVQQIDALCEWFENSARNLPWRRARNRKRNAYAALVAETMLQQTQVLRVVERYRAFMKRFPNVKALASADEQDVLSMWQGLGYYRRARNLHRAARMIVDEFGGRIPQTVEQLRELPGVGRYTAGAIASIVFGAREPIVDGNVRRVLARWMGIQNRMSDAQWNDWSWKIAAEFVGFAPNPGQFNEAMMELGATVCTPSPRTPRCEKCPVARFCKARRMGDEKEIPRGRARAQPRAAVHHAVVVVGERRRGNHVLVEQRNGNGMWSNMWQVPTIESDRALNRVDLQSRLGIPVNAMTRCGEFEHQTTHRKIRFVVYRATTDSRRGVWKRWGELEILPMGNAQRRVLREAACGKGPRRSASG